jgi:hypothetical protein
MGAQDDRASTTRSDTQEEKKMTDAGIIESKGGKENSKQPLEFVPEIQNTDDRPDTVAVKLGKAIAGAAIDDHFLDIVLPTLNHSLGIGRDRILKEVDKLIVNKVSGDLTPIVEPMLRKLVREEVVKTSGGASGLTIELYDPAEVRTSYLSRQHFMFPVLLRLLCVRDRNDQPLNIAVTGPAGNGKTSMALNCAEALGIEPVLQPFTPQTTKSDLLGYMAANGEFVRSPFYEAFTKGKIFIADEFDAANPAIAVTLNAAVANRTLTFPNLETVKAHPNFRAVFIMNTMGRGADHQYTGRMRQDAATLDRMVYLEVPIDKGLEAAIANVEKGSPPLDLKAGGHFKGNEKILAIIQSIRNAIEELDMKYIVSPRATLHATAMHAAEFGRRWIMDCCVWRGMSETDRRLISEKAGVPYEY